MLGYGVVFSKFCKWMIQKTKKHKNLKAEKSPSQHGSKALVSKIRSTHKISRSAQVRRQESWPHSLATLDPCAPRTMTRNDTTLKHCDRGVAQYSSAFMTWKTRGTRDNEATRDSPHIQHHTAHVVPGDGVSHSLWKLYLCNTDGEPWSLPLMLAQAVRPRYTLIGEIEIAGIF